MDGICNTRWQKANRWQMLCYCVKLATPELAQYTSFPWSVRKHIVAWPSAFVTVFTLGSLSAHDFWATHVTLKRDLFAFNMLKRYQKCIANFFTLIERICPANLVNPLPWLTCVAQKRLCFSCLLSSGPFLGDLWRHCGGLGKESLMPYPINQRAHQFNSIQSLCKILGWQTKSIMVCYAIFWSGQLQWSRPGFMGPRDWAPHGHPNPCCR